MEVKDTQKKMIKGTMPALGLREEPMSDCEGAFMCTNFGSRH